MAATFPQAEHTRLAQDFLDRAETALSAGDAVVGAELLWGATAHAMIAVALQQGLPYDSHGAFKNVARRQIDDPDLPEWLSEFNIAEQFHKHFYHGSLSDRQLAADRLKVRRFVGRLLTLAE